MILIDTNALIILIIGQIDSKLINSHRRTSIYEEQDYFDLVAIIKDYKNLVVLPNIWTEVDNLLNNFGGDLKYKYILAITETIKSSSEKYINSLVGIDSVSFFDLGLTDSLLLSLAPECDFLITSDSSLSDYAVAINIKVYDIVKNRNIRLN